jgi:hypothetical protein
MSFDLWLYTRPGAPPIERQAFLDFFQNDPHRVSGDTVSWSNGETGVSFRLEYEDRSEQAETEEAKNTPPHLFFNMNFFRPHIFGVEAELVLTRLVERFDLTVSDPQGDGMGEGEYSTEGFLRSWNTGNEWACRAMTQMGRTNPFSLPRALNRAYWSWNFSKAEFAQDLWTFEDIDVFVPRIMFLAHEGRARSFCIFPNLVPTAVPKVDFVLVIRDELAEPNARDSSETPALISWQQLREAARDFKVVPGGPDEETQLDYLLLFSADYHDKDTAPEDLMQFVIGLPDWPGKPTSITVDQILDAELVAS